MREGTLRRWANLLYILKYSLVFALLLLYLPLTVFPKVSGSTLLGGLFLELSPWGLFWAALGFFCTAWALMITTALLVDGTDKDLPAWAGPFFRLPIERAPFLVFTALGVWGCVLTVTHGDPHASWLWKIFAPIAAFLVADLLLHLLTLPARLADPEFRVFSQSWVANVLWRIFDRPWLRRLFAKVRALLSIPFRLLRVRAALTEGSEGPGGRPVLASGHFFALTCFLGLLVILLTVGWIYFPPRGVEPAPPAAVFLYILLTLLVWTINGLEHNLAPIHISPLLVLLLIFLVVYLPQNVDHYYQAEHTPPAAPSLTPVDVVGERDTLVIIASSGGGILASGWTTLAMERLIQDRPQLVDEIRLLSTVSGSSVGAAFYTQRVRQVPDLQTLDPGQRKAVLEEAYRNSVESSLASAAYGFAFLDFWRLFLGDGLPPLERWDRGVLLENNWGRIAGEVDLSVDALRPAIRDGRIPSTIFASTLMETGRRVMITPLDFVPREVRDRTDTLSEYLSSQDEAADLSIWTAARMSATFPYISPAASARFANVADDAPPGPPHWHHHLIDGGYFDNFGVTSALDWLEPVLDARLREEIPARRIFILTLTPFPYSNPLDTPPTKGAYAALAGPLIGILGIQGGIATSRNAIDLQRFMRSWNERFRERGIDACVATAEIRPPQGGPPEPLSWHLTEEQKSAQRALWPESPTASGHDTITVPWREMKKFLDDTTCPD